MSLKDRIERVVRQASLVRRRVTAWFERAPPEVTESMRAVLKRLADAVQTAATEGVPAPLPIGLTDLDTLIGGLRVGELTVIEGLPGVGKTSLALQVALNVGLQVAFSPAAEFARRALVFSYRESSEDLATR